MLLNILRTDDICSLQGCVSCRVSLSCLHSFLAMVQVRCSLVAHCLLSPLSLCNAFLFCLHVRLLHRFTLLVEFVLHHVIQFLLTLSCSIFNSCLYYCSLLSFTVSSSNLIDCSLLCGVYVV